MIAKITLKTCGICGRNTETPIMNKIFTVTVPLITNSKEADVWQTYHYTCWEAEVIGK